MWRAPGVPGVALNDGASFWPVLPSTSPFAIFSRRCKPGLNDPRPNSYSLLQA